MSATDIQPVPAQAFGRTSDGREVTRYVLEGSDGFRVGILDYGAIVHSLHAPDRDGELADVVLGYDDAAGYERDGFYLGAVVGRSAGRIADASFALDGERVTLARNHGAMHLHGGARGFGKAHWRATPLESGRGPALELAYRSADGEEGYPGNLDVRVTYSLREPGVLAVDYVASTDAPTIVNLTQHSYFNLAGEGRGDVRDHVLAIDADSFTPLGADLIPLGTIVPVEGTPLDFRRAHRVGERLDGNDEQLRIAGGYDHNFVLRGSHGRLARAAQLRDPSSGRVMEVWTVEPGMQLYSGNFLDGSRGKSAHAYGPRAGLCLETQHFPDAPNQPQFPSTVLRPGEVMRSRTEFRFSVQR